MLAKRHSAPREVLEGLIFGQALNDNGSLSKVCASPSWTALECTRSPVRYVEWWCAALLASLWLWRISNPCPQECMRGAMLPGLCCAAPAVRPFLWSVGERMHQVLKRILPGSFLLGQLRLGSLDRNRARSPSLQDRDDVSPIVSRKGGSVLAEGMRFAARGACSHCKSISHSTDNSACGFLSFVSFAWRG